MSGFNISVDLSALGMGELADGCEEAARPAAQAGAQVLYESVQRSVAGIGKVTGNLARSIYQAYSRDKSMPKGRAQYHVSWNYKKAPHGFLIEFGHVQRYVVYVDKRGQWKTLVRPEMRGKPRPNRKAPYSVKDAYYVPLKGGPRIVGARPFIRPATAPAVVGRARNAMRDRWWAELQERGLIT